LSSFKLAGSGLQLQGVGDLKDHNCQITTNVRARHNIQLAEEAPIYFTRCFCRAFCLVVALSPMPAVKVFMEVNLF